MKIQNAVLCAALFYSLESYAIPPSFIQNFVPVVIVNNTNVNPSDIYFLAHGLDQCGLPAFLVPDGTNGECTYHYPQVSGTPGSANPLISKQLSSLPTATGTNIPANSYLIYLPIDSSSRGYISVYNPMYLPTAFNPAPSRMVLDILDSSVTSPTDPNYYTLYQDFEFGLVPLVSYSGTGVALGSSYGTQLFLNLSWVDYFALPMQLEVYSNVTHQPVTSSPSSGTLANLTREQVIQMMQTSFSNAPHPTGPDTTPPWEFLSIPFYNNPYGSQPSDPQVLLTTLRILAAKNSISLGSSTAFQGGSPTQHFFPADYVHNTNYGTSGSTTFMQSAYTFFTTNTLYCKIIPANPQPGISYTYAVSSTSNNNLLFTYNGDTPTGGYPIPINLQLSLADLTTEELLSGSVWPFTTDGTTPAPATQTAFENELSKMISSLFTIGLFPSTLGTTSTTPFLVTDAGFAALPKGGNTDAYFIVNTSYPGGYWFNLYDQALHALEIGQGTVANNPSYGLGYGYDFDDVLNLAGLIQPVIQDQYGNTVADQPYIQITLGSLTGTPVININTDKYTTDSSGLSGYQTIPYPIQVGPLAPGTATEVTFLWYDNTLTLQPPTPAPISGNTTLTNLTADETHPFQVQFKYDGITYTYNINALRQVTTPSSPTNSYSTIDQTYVEGIVFTLITNPSNYLLIAVNSTTPPWPG